MTVATVSPIIIWATAEALLDGPASSAATNAPTPKYAPCGKPAMKREIKTVSGV
ncbi:hypothetical protein COLO4_02352 [Corchorus olitorius]|uniref:Uncharacterized protein n=1 Tax=Corchorus olitorius TaxID=93759 RepID=A0A1R3L1A0_9ROSI|nr:hypothetical protein COLO4_02352 [Corchorus olitorius]